MAEPGEAKQVILDRIIELAPEATSLGLHQLAEAYAWATNVSQPHGGSATTPT
jgi:hypothetical protein